MRYDGARVRRCDGPVRECDSPMVRSGGPVVRGSEQRTIATIAPSDRTIAPRSVAPSDRVNAALRVNAA